MKYLCCDDQRREAVRAQKTLLGINFNGIDYLEVADDHILKVYFVHPLVPELGKPLPLNADNVTITGGERIRDIVIIKAHLGEQLNSLHVELNKRGDLSTYTLHIKPDPYLLRLDPLLADVDFVFPTKPIIDCKREPACQPELPEVPEIDYMAKDFASFRQLMLDRLTMLMPEWKERSPADLGVMLVEMLAYVGDHLSYQQDVIATEAYLSSARRRISVRRHARLLEYFVSDGCNARVWVQIRINPDSADKATLLPRGTRLITRVDGLNDTLLPEDSSAYKQALSTGPEVFETMHDLNGFAEHNEMCFHTWGLRECCLPKGSTSATLRGNLTHLQPGDVLIFQEMVGAHTGAPEDAEPTHRCAVRLTNVTPFLQDPLGAWSYEQHETKQGEEQDEIEYADDDEEEYDTEDGKDDEEDEETQKLPAIRPQTQQEHEEHRDREARRKDRRKHGKRRNKEVEESIREKFLAEEKEREAHRKKEHETTPTDYSIDITEIEWHYEDALPFPLCISATTDYEHGHRYIENVSVALGNIVLADHGLTLQETLPAVPASTLLLATTSGNRCEEQQSVPVPARFHPALKYTPLTRTSPYDANNPPESALAAMQLSAHNALPAITLGFPLESDPNVLDPAKLWLPKGDLLNSNAVDRHFVVESETDGSTYLRFGDDQHGLRPNAGTTFTAKYRIGNGVSGNIGHNSLYHIVSSDTSIESITNPLPASGGTEPETIEDVRQKIARAFLTQQRGVTPADYKDIAERHPEVQRANTVLRWTGSWYTVFLVVERTAGLPVDDAFKQAIRAYMESARMAGGDIVVVSPVYVSLEVTMIVTVQPDYFRANVKAALLEVFSDRQWPDGQRGIFYPTNYRFGQPVYLNPLYVAAMNVAGVASVDITTFQRQGIPGSGLADGMLRMDWLEVARLENDPNKPEHGIFILDVRDGK